MPIQPTALSAPPHLPLVDNGESSASRSPARKEAEEALHAILDVRTATDPQHFIHRLPEHIMALQRLAAQDTYSVPEKIGELARIHGVEKVLMPCIAGGTFIMRSKTFEEINHQLDSLNKELEAITSFEQRAAQSSGNSSIINSAVNFYKYGMAMVALSNLYTMGQLMLKHSPGQETNTLLSIMREGVALAIHAKLFGNLQSDDRVLDKINKIRNATMQALPQWNLANPTESLNDIMITRREKIEAIKIQHDALVEARDTAQDNLLFKDAPTMFIGLMTLVFVGHLMSMATPR